MKAMHLPFEAVEGIGVGEALALIALVAFAIVVI
jgi:hypothetical protein